MAKAVVNPEAELPRRPDDIEPTEEMLASLEVFATLKKSPAFAKFPGTCVLHHYRPGEVICRQGEAGGTAFYLLTAADIAALAEKCREMQPLVQQGAYRELQQRLSRLPIPGAPEGGAAEAIQPRRLATARLLVESSRRAPRRTSWWQRLFGPGAARANGAAARPATISNDGPADFDYDTRQAAIYEGEVFGEMSCLTRQPRSATIVADAECLGLEFLRNILEQMRKDPKYNEQAERKYRERVLEGHLRQLSIFQLLSEKDFQAVRARVELVHFAPGSVIWDEGDESDALYVVRSGLVQVIQGYPWLLSESDVTDWPALCTALGSDASPAVARLRSALPKEVQEALVAGEGQPPAETKRSLLAALNVLAESDALLSAKEIQPLLSDGRMREAAAFASKPKDWTGLQKRRGNRLFFHALFPSQVAPPSPVGVSRVLQYLGRGGVLGEIGVMRRIPRTATCVAYAHPRADIEATDVELVRVPADVVYEIEARSSAVRAEIQRLIAVREERSAQRALPQVSTLLESRRAEELGLLQGQNLMLIDLDRCTRCGDCVEACIDTHSDGYSRLFLDGPRYGKYLVPSSCRQCRDPVCMIGCPVGSIQQGEDGEIQIRDWCIGCGLCAEQCPYDSIQMHDAALLHSGAPGWLWTDGSGEAIGSNWMQPRFNDRDWRAAAAPHYWGIEMHQALRRGSGGGQRRLYFRVRFQEPVHARSGSNKRRLVMTSKGNALEAFCDGRPLELSQDAAQKKRFQYAADLQGEARPGAEHVLAIALSPPDEFQALVLDARIDTLAPEAEDTEEKLVTQRAVVCDQCSSLPGERHACVYACPHEAALRIDAWMNFPVA